MSTPQLAGSLVRLGLKKRFGAAAATPSSSDTPD
jgi:hypothetical protein